MIELKNIAKDVKFYQPSHSYTINGKILTSVTTVIHEYQEEFDKNGFIAASCAKREGITKEEILQRWEGKKNTAATRGTKFHKEIEDYINYGIIPDGEFKDIVIQFSQIKQECKLFPEIRLFNEYYGVAGTTDLVYLNSDNSIIVGDWKSNAAFTIKPKYGGKLLSPLSHLGDCHLVIYSLQLWCYSIMLEKFGYKIRDNPLIYWIDAQNNKIVTYRTLDLKDDAIKMLEHFRSLRNF